jgi:hypothetical protein
VKDLSWAVLNKGLKGAEVRAHLQDTLKCFFGFLLEVFRT